jgi:hypothetical protein
VIPLGRRDAMQVQPEPSSPCVHVAQCSGANQLYDLDGRVHFEQAPIDVRIGFVVL